MITLTAQERVIWSELRGLVRGSSAPHANLLSLSYLELGKRIDPENIWRYPMTRPPFRGLNEALGHVSMYEVEHGRPMLSALVVNTDTQRPGAGFAKLAAQLGRKIDDPDVFWREELSRVVSFWAADDQILIMDAAVNQVLTELTSVKRQLRQVAARLGSLPT